jgi:hypothetical protein
MSILNCYTRLSIVNSTGLPAVFDIVPIDTHMRVQPLDNARVLASVDTNAASLLDWVQEWFNLIRYGPTYNRLKWTLEAGSTAVTRFQLTGPMTMAVTWGDPSVSWKKCTPGSWTIDISKATDITIFFKSDIGEYEQLKRVGAPASVASVCLQPYLELACDEEIPFSMDKQPVAHMYWRPGIDIDNIVNPIANLDNPIAA